jgi:D-alanyl-D-alanine carboxypeptidase
MKKIITLLGLYFISHYTTAQIPAALQLRLQDTLEDMKAKYNFKGLSAAASFKSFGIWKSAVGESAAGVPLSPDMLIGIGSNTKTFVSVMMIKLSERGLVNLDDTIGKWVSGYANINGAATIRQLLNHTSGIYSYTDNSATWDSVESNLKRIWTKEEVLRKFVLTPSFAPGKGWEYSNTNYIIAGLIEEKITGKPIQQLLRDSILVPTNLTHVFFPPYEIAADPYAHLWTDWDGDKTLDDVGEYASSSILPKEVNSVADAAGAFVSTSEDIVKFWKALMRGSIISKTSVKNELLRWSGFGSSTSDYGLGIFKDKYLGNTVFHHGGTWIGQINENLSDTINDIYITLLSNQDSLKNEYVVEVVKALYKVMLDYRSLSIEATALSNSDIRYYPNPAKNILYVNHNNELITNLSLWDMTGKMILQQKVPPTESISIINTEQLESGIYLLRVQGISVEESTKIQVLK